MQRTSVFKGNMALVENNQENGGPESQQSVSEAQVGNLRAAGEQAEQKSGSGVAGQDTQECRKAWIEIKLLGDDGEGVKDEQYQIVTPDGASHKGKTDARGRARLEGIDPGTCTISFVNLDEEAWE